jgi:hypothetical protein
MLSLMPAPNCTPGSTTCPASNYITSVKAPENKDSADAHFDYSFTGKDRLSFGLVFIDYSLDYSPLFGPRAGGTFNLVTLNNSQIERLYTLNYTHIFSSNAVNELVLAFTRDLNDGGPTAGMQYESSIAGVGGLNTSSTDTQTTGFPLIYMVPSGTNIGGGLGGPFNQHHNIPQLADNFSFVKGRNQFKTGFLGRFREFNEMQSVASRGMYYFYAWETSYYLTGGDQFASALLGVPIDAERQLVPHEFGQRIKEFGTYFQDDLKLNKRLTLNLGVRWDLYNPATEAHNRLANFDPATVKMVLPGNGVSASTLDTNYKNIGPHLGFAYALTADGKTSLRGGYGIAYLPLATQGVGTTTDRLNQNSPFAYSIGPNLYIENALGLPTPGTLLSDGLPAAPPADPAIPALGAQVVYIPKSQPTPYVQQWNLNIQ